MPTFTRPLDDPTLTRDFYFRSSIYIGGLHAAGDYVPRIGPATGAPIKAIAAGTVVGVGWDFRSGFFVAINHAGGWRSIYRHLYGQSPVSVGQQVHQGQIIGNVGNTGWSEGAHLHFDLWNIGRVWGGAFYKNGWWAVDPEIYLEDDMSQAEVNALKAWQRETATLVRDEGAPYTPAYYLKDGVHYPITAGVWEASGRDLAAVVGLPHATIMQRAPTRGRNATVEEVRNA